MHFSMKDGDEIHKTQSLHRMLLHDHIHWYVKGELEGIAKASKHGWNKILSSIGPKPLRLRNIFVQTVYFGWVDSGADILCPWVPMGTKCMALVD